jgi:orotidine-5'-phosphate decarboxylase
MPIGSTAEGYVDAYLRASAWLHADAVTVNPYLGLDTLEPWLAAARARGKGVVVLLARRIRAPKTSRMSMLKERSRGHVKPRSWLRSPRASAANVGGRLCVVGATAPAEARLARALLPDVIFWVPGYGAPGAGAAEALAGAIEGGPVARGVIVSSSRAVLYPAAGARAVTLSEWDEAVTAAVEVEAAKSELRSCHQ